MHSEDKEKLSLEELGELMKKARKTKEKEQGKKITHKMVAEVIGVDRVTVIMWEQGKKHPGFLNILNYCNFLDMTIDELLETKKIRTLYIELTEEERDTILSMIDECKREPENNLLHSKLHFLEQHMKAFFSRASTK